VPYNERLEENIEKIIGSGKKIEKRRMFGGICYLMNGNMCFGIYKEYLIVRTGIEVAEKKLKERNVKPFDITGKAMKGWVMVGEEGWKRQDDLKEWLDLGKEYGLTLPKKHS
jgi:TfoX/Sxy family transcriptional regulator of competence genes